MTTRPGQISRYVHVLLFSKVDGGVCKGAYLINHHNQTSWAVDGDCGSVGGIGETERALTGHCVLWVDSESHGATTIIAVWTGLDDWLRRRDCSVLSPALVDDDG